MNVSVITFAAIIFFASALVPLILCAKNPFKLFSKKASKKRAIAVNIIAVFSVCILMSAVTFASVITAQADDVSEADTAQSEDSGSSLGLGLIGAALATGLSGVGAGIAVASSASAAIGAISENPRIFGQALIFVALAEGIALYGLIISIQILAKI